MKALITGGTGFIGRTLCQRLSNSAGAQCDKRDLTILARSPERARRILGEGPVFIDALEQLPPEQKFDVVINLAGEGILDKRWTPERKRLLHSSRVGVTRQLVDYFRRMETKPGVFISGSAVGYYGDSGDAVLDEYSDFSDDFAHRLCADWEQAALEATQLDIRTCVIRTGIVLGRNGGALARMLTPFRLGLGGRIGSGRQYFSWIHLEDHIEAMLFLINHPVSEGIYNLTAPNPVTNQQLTRALALALKRPAPFPVPAAVLKLALGEMSCMLLEGQRVQPTALQREGFQFRYPEITTALKCIVGK